MSRSSVVIARVAACLVTLLVMGAVRTDAGIGCGNGSIEQGEECDDGGANGTTACGCKVDCTFPLIASPCGDPTMTACDLPDACDGAGSCLPNYLPPSPCGDPTDTECDDPDFCDGLGACRPSFAQQGTSCGSSSDTACDNPDTCNGQGSCATNREPDDTPCTSDGQFCTGIESCRDGACLSPGDPCDPDTESCDENVNLCLGQLDLDGDGQIEPLTDGLLFLRYLFGFRGSVLITGAYDAVNCTRCTAGAIESYIDSLL